MAKNRARTVSAALGRMMAAVLLSSTAWAAVPLLQIAQLTNTNCPYGNFYPSTDAKAKKVVFTSVCDLVHGQNADGNSEIFVMSLGGAGLTQLTNTTGGVGSVEPQLASNGEFIVFASDRDLIPGQNADGNFEIFVMHTDGTHLTQLTNTIGGRVNLGFPGNTGPCLDPKAQKITFSSDRDLVPGNNADGNNDLFVMNVDGSALRQLTFTTGGFGQDGGCLNATNTRMVFDSDRDFVGQNSDGNYEVFTMDVNGSNIVQLTNTVNPDTIGNVGSLWTADGKTIFFRSDINFNGNNPDANQEAFRMNADGTGMVQLTSSVGGFGSAITGVTPDGKTLMIESDADLVPGNNLDRNGELFAMRITP